ncbi:MAG: hypothetical protein EOO61_22245 [Hymenobacter sp.]|nr:MAG: hypothetical protein EOO61_22245 [Hymenobacter sp.]
MQRRKFLQQLALLTGGFIASSYVPAAVLFGRNTKVKGRVLSNGNGLVNVVISDGYSVITTDKKGRYELKAHPDAVAIFISTPAGHAFLNDSTHQSTHSSLVERFSVFS